MKTFQEKLLGWYGRHARDLPWRKTKDPYKIWVSEMMLQQTQVDTVIPYYEKWVRRFPTIESLAKASSSEVMKHWAGLGYYRRARMLHEGAKILCRVIPARFRRESMDPRSAKKRGEIRPDGFRQLYGEQQHSGMTKKGELPRHVNDLMKIPGIGRYTAGAIASIAFNEKAPVLDGNVIRVLTRLYAIGSDIQSPKTIKKLWELAESILPEKNVGDFNQALMELGATVCLPQNPRCLICPVNPLCKARAAGNPERFPVKKKKEKLLKDYSCALILKRNGRVLIQRQPEEGRWGGLWMFPWWKKKGEMIKEMRIHVGARRAVPLHLRKDRPQLRAPLHLRKTIYHGFTKYRVTLEVYELINSRTHPAAVRHPSRRGDLHSPLVRRRTDPSVRRKRGGPPQAGRGVLQSWVPIKDLQKFPFPSPHLKIVEEILNG